ncbi:MAG: hypothetical protein IPI50_05695 [Saprospiraceae bacterium]|nr:hypothetical protein [Saprospiraceae bacterium]
MRKIHFNIFQKMNGLSTIIKYSLFGFIFLFLSKHSQSAQCQFKSVSCGFRYTMAIGVDGSLWGWGANEAGQLGDGTNQDHDRPVQIGTDKNWKQIESGINHSFAIKEDGSLWAWGLNGYGALGIGHTDPRNTPVRVGQENNWEYISMSIFEQTAAIKKDGTLWVWGTQLNQIGATKDSSHNPIPFQTAHRWKSIAINFGTCIGITQNGALWSWGSNNYGLLGLGHFNNTITFNPTRIGISSNWNFVDISDGHAIALNNLGELYSWGSNTDGVLGHSAYNVNINSPTKVNSNLEWKTVKVNKFSLTTGFGNTFGIKKDGTLWVWGSGAYNLLVDQSLTRSNVPVRIGQDTNWINGDIGWNVCFGIKKDSSTYSWGKTVTGKLGHGQLSDVKVPKNLCCKASSSLLQYNLCHNDTILIRGKKYFQTQSTAQDTLVNFEGCDSIVSIQLFFYPEDTSNYIDTLCYSDQINIFGKVLNRSNPTEYFRIANAKRNGCDSIVEVSFYFPDSIHISEEISADSQNVLVKLNIQGGLPPYQFEWNTGDTSREIILPQDGVYSVTVTDRKNCKAVKIYYFKTSADQKTSEVRFNWYQSADKLYLTSENNPISEVFIYDFSGRIVYSEKTNTEQVVIPRTAVQSGLFILKAKFQNGEYKVLKFTN